MALGLGNWKLEALILTQNCTIEKKVYQKQVFFFPKAFTFPTRSLAEISANIQKHQLIHTKFVKKNVVSDQGEFWWRQCWRHKENIDISFIPNSSSIKRYYQNSNRYTRYKSHSYEKTVYLRYPAQFCTFRTAIFTTYLKRTFKCTPNHPFFVFVFSHLVTFKSFTILPYHTVPYYTISYHTIPNHTIPYHTVPYSSTR